MSFLSRTIKLPGEKHRGFVLAVIAGLSGLIPDTAATVIPAYVVIPAILGGFVDAYWRHSSLRQKLFVAFAASCCTFVIRLFTNWCVFGYSQFTNFMTANWVSRGLLLCFLGLQVLPTALTLIPLHFILSSCRRGGR